MSFVVGTGKHFYASTPRALDQPKDLRITELGRLQCPEPLSAKQIIILRHIMPSLTDEFLLTYVIPILTKQSAISLRALDWAVVNYCKKWGVAIEHNHNIIDIHDTYINALTHWRRRNFDPFRRRTRVFFSVNDQTYESTCGQLCFLVWANKMGIYAYVVNNIADIERDMSETNLRCREDRSTAKKRRRSLSTTRHVPCRIQQTSTHHFG
jgi:hypothetical protein